MENLFKKLIQKFPNLRLATAQDAQRIDLLFREMPMQLGNLSITFSRMPNFFNLNKIQGHKVFNIVQTDEFQNIKGFCAVSIRYGYVDGNLEAIAYTQDLRVSSTLATNEKNTIPNFYSAVVEACHSNKNNEFPKFIHTAVLDANTKARRYFASEHFPLKYHRMSNYHAYLFPSVSLPIWRPILK